MTTLDFVLLGLLLLFAGLGFWRGLVSEVMAIVAWVAGILVAWLFAPHLATQMSFIEAPGLRHVVAFATLLIGVLLVAGILRWVLRELLRAAGLGTADRVLGASFGALKGLLIALLMVLGAGLTGLSQAGWWREAVFTPPLETAVLAARPWLPDAVAKRVRFD